MITKLTKEQEDLLPVYAQKSIQQGLCCDPIDEDAAVDYGKRIITWLGGEYKETVILDSPYAVYANYKIDNTCNKLDNGVRNEISDKFYYRVLNGVLNEIRNEVEIEVENEVWNKLGIAVWNAVWGKVGDKIWNKAWNKLGIEWNKVWNEVWIKVWSEIRNKGWNELRSIIWGGVMGGQFLSHQVAWYKYYKEVLKINPPSIWQIEDQIQFGGVCVINNICIIYRRPEFIKLNSKGQLHCNNGAALSYRDGYSIYALNGVTVPDWLALQSENEIDPREFSKIKNVEVRREFIRKVGIERIANACGFKLLDKLDNYELIAINLGGKTGYWPYLKMLNPSIKVYHLEAVDKEIKTVEQALNWRNNCSLKPRQLT